MIVYEVLQISLGNCEAQRVHSQRPYQGLLVQPWDAELPPGITAIISSAPLNLCNIIQGDVEDLLWRISYKKENNV